MTKAIEMASEQLNICIPEFTVCGIPHGTFFAHKWYIATDDQVNHADLGKAIDDNLKILNDDYEVERRHALKAVEVEVLPVDTFLDFMNARGKVGGQHKFPRVLKGNILEEWQGFLQQQNAI
jgi:hypothetical protein